MPRSLTVLIEPVGISNGDNRAIDSDHDVAGILSACQMPKETYY